MKEEKFENDENEKDEEKELFYQKDEMNANEWKAEWIRTTDEKDEKIEKVGINEKDEKMRIKMTRSITKM